MKSSAALGLLLIVVGLLPLMGGPRYEAALIAGLLGPPMAAVCAAIATGRKLLGLQQADGNTQRVVLGWSLWLQALSLGLLHLLAILVAATWHGVRVGFCEPAMGYALLLLGPGLGIVLGALCGALSGAVVWSVRIAHPRAAFATSIAVALGFPLCAVIVGLVHFYRSPAVFAYSPFVGYFSGPVYDTVVYDLERLLTYRAGTMLTLAALSIGLCLVHFRSVERGIAVGLRPASRENLALLATGLLAALGSAAHGALGVEMGLSSTAPSIQRSLGRMTQRGRCKVYFGAGVDAQIARRVAGECVGHLAQLEQYFDLEFKRDVTVYLFENASQKRFLMGAADTYIAKPWRREIYIQPGSYPHQVLGHELAHVVTGQFGSGPLRIAGSLGGWVPDPGRIEGFAEAASPREDSEGTLHEWTAAMKQLELLPRLPSLFRLTFLGDSAARSYSASGSFVDYVRQTYGPQVIKDWYGGDDLQKLTERSWVDLEKQFLAFLDGVKVPADVVEIARPRFSRPGVFERRCPHAVDRAISRAHGLCSVQPEDAQRHANRAIELDPTKVDIELSMARCGWFSGHEVESMEELARRASNEEKYAVGSRRAAYEFAGSIAWNRGELARAKEYFKSARKLAFRRNRLRNLDVKIWALDQEPDVRTPLRTLLAPRPGQDNLALIELTRWSEDGPHEDLARYLLFRIATRNGETELARSFMKSLSAEKLPLKSLRLEASRMRLISACLHVQRGSSKNELDEALQARLAQDISRAARREAQRMAERCRIAGRAIGEGK